MKTLIAAGIVSGVFLSLVTVSSALVGPAAVPTVGIRAVDYAASEPGTNTGMLVVSREGGGTNEGLWVNVRVSGTASNGVDYSLIPDSVLIPAGTNLATILVQPLDDLQPEPVETVVVILSSNNLYRLGMARYAVVSIEDNDRSNNVPPLVRLTWPTNNATYRAPARIEMNAEAVDPDGRVVRVEFCAGDRFLGSDTNAPYGLVWTNVPPGAHILRARAIDELGLAALSDPVSITVNDGTLLPVVFVEAPDRYASEPGVNTGLFRISRTGPTNADLVIPLAWSGTASNGVDYASLPPGIVIPAGAAGVPITVTPLDDALIEPTESVVLTLLSHPNYILGSVRQAVVGIEDDDRTNAPPSVRLTAPLEGALFAAPATIPLGAEAVDRDGQIVRVDFFAGDRLLGSDETGPYQGLWTNVPPGLYTLSARALDNLGVAAWSGPVHVTVTGPQPRILAVRRLPAWYVPGVTFVVTLKVELPSGVAGYEVFDRPPEGWTVGNVSTGGVAETDAVHFGPFADNRPRLLTYEITPAPDDIGERRFAGAVIAGDRTNAIPYVNVIVSVPPHPADAMPADFVMSGAEVDAYNQAWRSGARTVRPPNPVPINYLTRAGFLWECGESYQVTTRTPTPPAPLLWVPVVPPPDTPTNEPAWSLAGYGAAYRAMPSNAVPGTPVTVTIIVMPADRTRVYAVQERPPDGWGVSDISDEGVFCPVTRSVKWGLFTNAAPRTLTYTVTPRLPASTAPNFYGVASFDGINVPIAGRSRLPAAEGAPQAAESLGAAATETSSSDDALLFGFLGEAGLSYMIEASSDLVEWKTLEHLLNSDGVIFYSDPDTSLFDLRFYRAEPVE